MFNNGGTWHTITDNGFKEVDPNNKTSIDKMADIENLTDYEFSTVQKADGFLNQAEKDVTELKDNVLSSIKLNMTLIVLGIGTVLYVTKGK